MPKVSTYHHNLVVDSLVAVAVAVVAVYSWYTMHNNFPAHHDLCHMTFHQVLGNPNDQHNLIYKILSC